jgi:hypothetical protein
MPRSVRRYVKEARKIHAIRGAVMEHMVVAVDGSW